MALRDSHFRNPSSARKEGCLDVSALTTPARLSVWTSRQEGGVPGLLDTGRQGDRSDCRPEGIGKDASAGACRGTSRTGRQRARETPEIYEEEKSNISPPCCCRASPSRGVVLCNNTVRGGLQNV